MSTQLNVELFEKLDKIKRGIVEKVPQGTKFIFGCMEGGKVPSDHSKSNRFGLWPAAEMAHFLLTNHILPKTCSQRIEQIIDFLIDNFDKEVGAWPATINGTQVYFSAHITGYCTFVFKLYYNDFLTDDRKKEIRDIIKKAEAYLVSKQQEAGFWTPESTKGAAPSSDGINYADFFYSYYAYFGIREVSGYHRDSHTDINNSLDRAKKYFRKYAETLINQQSHINADLAECMSNVSKVLQVLNDFDDKSLSDDIDKLHSISLQIFDKVKDSFATTSVRLDRVDDGAQNMYNNNTPFDVYFALRSDKHSLDNLLQVVKWYLDHQDIDDHCWYLKASPMTKTNTWTTIEAMLVLSDAYDFLSEDFYLSEMQQIDSLHIELDTYKEEIVQKQKEQQSKFERDIRKVKKTNKTLLGLSVGFSIIFSIVCFVLFLLVVSQGLTPVLETFINVVIFSLAGNALFQGAVIVVQVVIQKTKELDNDTDNK